MPKALSNIILIDSIVCSRYEKRQIANTGRKSSDDKHFKQEFTPQYIYSKDAEMQYKMVIDQANKRNSRKRPGARNRKQGNITRFGRPKSWGGELIVPSCLPLFLNGVHFEI